MSLRSLFDRSRDALYTLAHPASAAAVERVEDMGAGNMVGSLGFGHGLFGGNDLRNVLFWAAIVVVLLLLAALSNPNENSFRSHLTELSFRRHLVDIRTSDSLHPSSSSGEHQGDSDSTTIVHPVTHVTPGASSTTPAPTPFRFANHVAINLRTPPMLYRSHWFFSTGIATPLASPCYLALSDPLSVLKRGRERERDRSTVFIGFFGHWSPVTISIVSQLIVAILGDGREKGKRRERPGIIDVKAVSAKDDAPSSKALPLAPKLLKPDPVAEPHVPPTVTPSLSRRPSLGQQPADVPDSPLVISLKADLAAATSTLNELKSQLQLSESSTDSTLTSTLDDLRNRRKEDDAERQELKSKTKSLEDQKRQAESARREAEKKLRAVEALRDGLESKIAAARNEAVETRENMVQSEKNVRSIQEEGAKHVVETLDNVEKRREELGKLEDELVDLESRNEELGQLVKEAEDRLKVVTESGARASPEEEMMMMAAAYEAAAQEGYLHQSHTQTQSQWANQAAAYMAEAGMPYLGQDYTARSSSRVTSASANANANNVNHHNHQHPDLGGFDDFGPGSGHALHHPPPAHQHVPTLPPARSLDVPSSAFAHAHPRTPEAQEEEEEEVEIGPGSPNGTSFLPQGLFRSLEGDATPMDLEGHESGSDFSGEDQQQQLWRSPPMPEIDLTRRMPPPPSSTTPPAAVNPSGPAPGIPGLPGSRRWFSGTSSASAENVAFSGFMHPMGTTSNDSLNFDPSSAFAPSASEKKALKWGPLSKYRWARGNDTAGPGGAPVSGPSARSSSVDLGNGVVPTSISGGPGTSPSSGGWLAARFGGSSNHATANSTADARAQAAFSAFSNSGSGSNHLFGGLGQPLYRNASAEERYGHGQGGQQDQDQDQDQGEADGAEVGAEDDRASEKKSFRFFSLRKTPSSTS